VRWERVQDFKGIVQMYRDVIALRRNLANKTGGRSGANRVVFHGGGQDKALAHHRSRDGGAGDLAKTPNGAFE